LHHDALPKIAGGWAGGLRLFRAQGLERIQAAPSHPAFGEKNRPEMGMIFKAGGNGWKAPWHRQSVQGPLVRGRPISLNPRQYPQAEYFRNEV